MEYDRIVKRFEYLQSLGSGFMSDARREWPVREAPLYVFSELVEKHPDESRDETLLTMKLANNINFARARNNKYLLSEDMTQFPIMNYDLKEGPYCPPDDAVFGPEDKHVVIQGDTDLIFFQPEINGLERGLIVENLL